MKNVKNEKAIGILILGFALWSSLAMAATKQGTTVNTIEASPDVSSEQTRETPKRGDRIGILGGVNFSSYSHVDQVLNGTKTLYVSNKGSFDSTFGLSYEAPLVSNNLSLQPELRYIHRGVVLKGHTKDWNDVEHTQQASIQMHYLQIPLLLKGKLHAGAWEFTGFAGPYAGFVLSSRTDTVDYTHYEPSKGDYMTADPDALHRFDYGFAGGFGTGYNVTDRFTVVGEARIDSGLTNLLKATSIYYNTSDLTLLTGLQYAL